MFISHLRVCFRNSAHSLCACLLGEREIEEGEEGKKERRQAGRKERRKKAMLKGFEVVHSVFRKA